MQCILQTHQLGWFLDDVGKRTELVIPFNGSIKFYDDKIELNEANILIAQKEMAFVETFRDFVNDFNIGRFPNPQPIFSMIAQRCPRFRGWQQQDSHELLRYLLDGLRLNETDPVKASVKNYLKDQECESVNRTCLAYMKFFVPAIDGVFGGVLLVSFDFGN
jgi:ubiquitin C-terminal hydrolase